TTRQRRLRNGSLLDQYAQTHTWDVHGDRTGWTMPSYSGLITSSWTTSLQLRYDDGGNLTRMDRLGGAAGLFFEATYRGAERAERREVHTPNGVSILRQYEYNSDSLLSRLAVTANGTLVAG